MATKKKSKATKSIKKGEDSLPAKKKRKKNASKKKTKKASASKVTAPAVRTPSKTSTDPAYSRFSALLPDIEGLTEQIIDADLDASLAMQVTSKADDLVDWAPNALTWCADKRFLGMAPYAKQCEILLELFEEYCPKCSDIDYVKDIPVLDPFEKVTTKVAMMEFGKCPHCSYTKGQGREDGYFRDPLELVIPLGQRAGKSSATSLAASYLIHRNLALPVPWESYGLLAGQVLDFTFVATTKQQSEKTLWGQFKGLFTGSTWFKSYKEVCDLEGRKSGIPITVKNLETYLSFGHKRLLIYFAANDPGSLRGSTRFGGAIDELSWFGNSKEGAKRANGPETYTALNNSCLTIRGAVDDQIAQDPECIWPQAIMFNLSSPVSMDDPLMTLYRDSAKNPRAVRRHWATWEASPKFTKEYLTKIGEMAKPNAERDYGAQPPVAHNPLFKSTDAVKSAFRTPMANEERYGPLLRPSALAYTEEIETAVGARQATMLTAGLQEEIARPNIDLLKQLPEEDREALGPHRELFEELLVRPPWQRMHVMGVDLGTSNNGLGVVCGYLSDSGKFVTDFVIEIKPTQRAKVDISAVYKGLIVPLVDRLNVVAVVYDRWQGLHQVQDLASKFGSMGPLNDNASRRAWLRKLAKQKKRPAFIADQYSLSMADAQTLVGRVEQGDCLFPAMEIGFMDLMVNQNLVAQDYPYAHLAIQMATVRASGNRILKPLSKDDDIFRAWANAAVPAMQNELVIDLLGQQVRPDPDKKNNGNSSFHVSLGQTGKGVRQVGNVGTGASSQSGTANFPVVVRKGKFGS